MGTDLLFYSGLMLLGILTSAIAQVLLKKASQCKYSSVIEEYLNIKTVVAYMIFFAANLLSIYAYKVVPLSFGGVLEATGYIYVMIFGSIFFAERITLKKVVSIGLIISGIIIYSVFGL